MGARILDMLILLGVLVLMLLALFAAKSRDRAVKGFIALAVLGGLVALATWFISEFRWVRTTNCREAFPGQFGYRDSLEAAGGVEDVQIWWPMGHQCQGINVDTGALVVMGPGWGTSLVVYSALAIAAVALTAVVLRVALQYKS
ncbi:hypothetical protein B2J88_51425 [Rhodococcus sp. SRB_17]|nr:hypothetical protein [Rhodococcus sp. SRB_17]